VIAPRVVIVGHVEWVTHALGTLPGRGHIADLHSAFDEPAGGGGVAAAAAAREGADVTLVTALGRGSAADRALEVLTTRGVRVVAARRDAAQTPVLTITEPDGERTIMVVGQRLQARMDDAIHHAALHGAAAAYYTGEDPRLLADLRVSVGTLVVSARRLADIVAGDVRADVIVGSGNDPDENLGGLPDHLRPAWTVRTDGAAGGSVTHFSGHVTCYTATAPAGPVVDTYGCGDSFAAGLTVGLARGLDIEDAISVGARAGATCVTWRGGLGPA